MVLSTTVLMAFLPGAETPMVRTSANSPLVALHGRPSSAAGDLPVLGWSGTGATIRFSGTSCTAVMRSKEAWWDLEVDGRKLTPFPSHESTSDSLYPLVSGLAEGEHVVTFRKRTEVEHNRARLNAFLTDGPVLAAAPAPARRIQFVGNSLTCGYGALDSVGSNRFSLETEDYFSSMAGIAARAFGADDHAICWSGRGVVRNYNMSGTGTVPDLWELADPTSNTSKWDHSRWTPHVVVVDLGANDYMPSPPPDSAAFEDRFFRFLRRIRSVHPQVPIVLADGPFLWDTAALRSAGAPAFPNKARLAPHMRSLAKRMADSGEAGVVAFSFRPANPGLGFGADFHPTAKQHLESSRELVAFLGDLMGWDTVRTSVDVRATKPFSVSRLRADAGGWTWDDATASTRWQVLDASGSLLAQGQGQRIPHHLLPRRGWRWALRSDIRGIWTLP